MDLAAVHCQRARRAGDGEGGLGIAVREGSGCAAAIADPLAAAGSETACVQAAPAQPTAFGQGAAVHNGCVPAHLTITEPLMRAPWKPQM
jgi:hypothetical protein